MPVSNVWLRVDASRTAEVLGQAAGNLDEAGSEAVLDFSAVNRIDTRALVALEALAAAAAGKSVKLTLYGVSPTVYKALVLMKLTARFSFLN
jgi:anti-anti-sigma regulatory factor